MIDDDRLTALMHDESLALEPPPDALRLVHRSSRRLRRRRRALLAAPLAVAVVGGLALIPTVRGGGPDSVVAAAFADVPITPDPDVRDRLVRLRGDAPLQDRGLELAVDQCMRDQQLPYEPTPVPDSYAGPLDTPDYGDDVAGARRDGYGIPAAIARERATVYGAPDAVARLSLAERGRYQQALFGPDGARQVTVPTPWNGGELGASVGGCLGTAQTEVFGSVEAALRADFASNGPAAALQRSAADPSVARLDRRWARCMSAAGHDFPDPAAARAAARGGYEQLPADEARRNELDIATDDATCEAATGYAPARRTIEDRYLTGLLRDYPRDLQLADTALRVAEQRAATLLAK